MSLLLKYLDAEVLVRSYACTVRSVSVVLDGVVGNHTVSAFSGALMMEVPRSIRGRERRFLLFALTVLYGPLLYNCLANEELLVKTSADHYGDC